MRNGLNSILNSHFHATTSSQDVCEKLIISTYQYIVGKYLNFKKNENAPVESISTYCDQTCETHQEQYPII